MLPEDAGAESMMFYSQDHWGYAHYLSDVAVRHPHLKRRQLGHRGRACPQAGHVRGLLLQFAVQQSDRLEPSGLGLGEREGRSNAGTCAGTSPASTSPYRQYVLGMMNEIFSRYEMAELFLDIFGIQFAAYHSSGRSPFCFCKYTEEAWNKDHPGDPYREGFKTPGGYGSAGTMAPEEVDDRHAG